MYYYFQHIYYLTLLSFYIFVKNEFTINGYRSLRFSSKDLWFHAVLTLNPPPCSYLPIHVPINTIKRSDEEKKGSLDRSRCSEDRDCCRLGGALDSFDYGRFDRQGEAVQIRQDSWHAAGPVGSRGPSPEPPRSDCNRATMPRAAPSFHAENTQTYSSTIARCPAQATRCLG